MQHILTTKFFTVDPPLILLCIHFIYLTCVYIFIPYIHISNNNVTNLIKSFFIKSLFIKSIFLFIDSLIYLLYHSFTYYFNFSFRHLTDLYVVWSLSKQCHSYLTCYTPLNHYSFLIIYYLNREATHTPRTDT